MRFVRPTVIFGPVDILINNIAWTLRTFDTGEYRQTGLRRRPVWVGGERGTGNRNIELDAVGPEIYTFKELVRLLADFLGKAARIVHVPPMVALLCTAILGRMKGDVMLTADEIRGLAANLLISSDPPTAPTRLSDWLRHYVSDVETRYASEFAKRA
jgi:hypothetical protein